MKHVSLSGSPRENVGSNDAATLRKEDRVPCVLYGGGDQLHFHVAYNDLSKLVITPNVHLIDLDVNGDKRQAVIKDVQFHPVTDRIIHIDFLELFEDKIVKIDLPVRVTGSAIGVRNGGRLLVQYRKLTVKGFPKEFPDEIVLDITKLRINQKIRVSDLDAAGLSILHDPQAVVVSIKTARGAMDEDEEDEDEEGEEGEGEGEGKEGEEGGEKAAEEKSEAKE